MAFPCHLNSLYSPAHLSTLPSFYFSDSYYQNKRLTFFLDFCQNNCTRKKERLLNSKSLLFTQSFYLCHLPAISLSAMMSALAMPMSAAVSMAVVMMRAHRVRIIVQGSSQIGLYLRICVSLRAWEQFDACLCQRIPCAAADTATDQHVNIAICQESG